MKDVKVCHIDVILEHSNIQRKQSHCLKMYINSYELLPQIPEETWLILQKAAGIFLSKEFNLLQFSS